MSLRRNTTPKNTEGCTTHRLCALLQVKTQAATVGGSGPFGLLSDDNLQEIARHFTITELAKKSTVDKRSAVLARRALTFPIFLQKYSNLISSEGSLKVTLAINGEVNRITFDNFLQDLATSGAVGLTVKLQNNQSAATTLLWDAANNVQTTYNANHLKSLDVTIAFFNARDDFKNCLRGVRIFTSLENFCIVSSAGLITGSAIFQDWIPQLTEEFEITLRALVHIKSLTLKHFVLDNEQSMRCLCDGLNALTKLNSLTIEQCALSNETWVQLSNTLQTKSQLSQLHITTYYYKPFINDMDNSDINLSYMKQMLENKTSITSLTVNGTGLGRACIKALSQLKRVGLTYLNVAYNKLSSAKQDYGLADILDNFEFLQNVEILQLNHTGLRNEDVPTLVKMIAHMKQLQAIHLALNQKMWFSRDDSISAEQEQLFEALKDRTALRTISISDISEQQKEKLKLILRPSKAQINIV